MTEPVKQSTDQIHFREFWQSAQPYLKDQFGDGVYDSWLAPLSFQSLEQGVLCLAVPTRFMKDWIQTHYLDSLQNIVASMNPTIKSIELAINNSAPQPPKPAEVSSVPSIMQEGHLATKPSEMSGRNLDLQSDQKETSYQISASLDKRFTFDNFVVGKSNELAHAAALRVAESDNVPFNPLFLYGGVGLGKTHLMHAIAWHIKLHKPEKKVLYMSAEKFMYSFVRALRYKDTMSFKEQFRSVDVLMIDDVQFIAGKDNTQEEFFHTFNALVDQNRQVIISADKSPSDLEGMQERMKSRLGWGLVADIHPTTYELRLGILQAKAEKSQAKIDFGVLEFLAHRITSNIRELEGALNRLIAHSTLVGRDITIDMTQDVLYDLLRANDRRLTIEEIQKHVAQHFNVKVTDMHSSRRSRSVARPRQVAMYLSKQLTSKSLPEIGKSFGGRDHTTVLHAVKKVEELLEQDKSFSEDLQILQRSLES